NGLVDPLRRHRSRCTERLREQSDTQFRDHPAEVPDQPRAAGATTERGDRFLDLLLRAIQYPSEVAVSSGILLRQVEPETRRPNMPGESRQQFRRMAGQETHAHEKV